MPLLHDVMNAYLAPLLKKHSLSPGSGGLVTYEDLISSFESAKTVLMESPNDFILVRRYSLLVMIDYQK